MAKTSKYAVNEICINGKTYVHNPLFRVVGTGSSPSNPEDGLLNIDWYEDYRGTDTGNVNSDGEGAPDVNGLRASVTFNIPYRGRVTNCYVAGESHSLYYKGNEVRYLDIPESTVLDIVYADGWWNIVSLPDIMCIKYDDLRWLTGIGYLIPGMKYRIIDYIPAIQDTQLINGIYYHVDASVTQFDIIVTALSKNELSEDAEACLPEQCAASRNYYKSFNVNLGSWKLKYTIDDNPIKYDWATGYVVNNPGTTVYTDGKKFAFGNVGKGEYMGYTSDYRYIRYQNSTPRYLFSIEYDSCYTVSVDVGTNATSGSKNFTVYDSTVTVYKQYQYIIDGELYYASGDIYHQGVTSQENVLLISESQYNSTTSASGIYIEMPMIFEYDEISAISWVSTNRGVVYNMIDDKGNEAPWDFKNICIGQITNTANIGHFFEKQCNGRIFRDESIEGNTIYNNVIKPVKGRVYIGTSPWSVYPYKLYSNRFRIVTQNSAINNSYVQTIHNNIIENCDGVTILVTGSTDESSDNHIKNSYNTTIVGKNNYISNLSSSTIYGSENTVLGTYKINIGSLTNPSSFNTVGSKCNTITIGENCFYNSIGAGCSNIILGSTDNYNSFGAGCSNITLGSSCHNNSYGNRCFGCYIRTTASSTATIRNYVENCHWDDGVKGVTLYNTNTNTNASYKVENVHVHRGMSFTTTKFVGVPINTAYEYTVTRALPSTSNSAIVS